MLVSHVIVIRPKIFVLRLSFIIHATERDVLLDRLPLAELFTDSTAVETASKINTFFAAEAFGSPSGICLK